MTKVKVDTTRRYDIPELEGWQYTRKTVNGYAVKEFADKLNELTFEGLILAAIDAFVDKVYHRDGGEVDLMSEDWHEVIVPLGLAARNSTLPPLPGASSDES